MISDTSFSETSYSSFIIDDIILFSLTPNKPVNAQQSDPQSNLSNMKKEYSQKVSLLQFFIDNEITQVITNKSTLLSKEAVQNQLKSDSEEELLDIQTEDDIEYMVFNKDIYIGNYFIDSLNEIVFYIKSPLRKTVLLLENPEWEMFIIVGYLIKIKNMKIDNAIEYIQKSINNQVDEIVKGSNEHNSNISKIINAGKEMNKLLLQFKSLFLYNQILKYEKEYFKEVEFLFKCSICRSTLFSNIEIDSFHQFTPKLQYSFKKYKNSFVKDNSYCSSYFLRDVEESFVNNKYFPKSGVAQKISYSSNEFHYNLKGTKLSCLKCGTKIGCFSPNGMQCSCGSWVVPSCQIVKSKVDKVPVNFNLSEVIKDKSSKI